MVSASPHRFRRPHPVEAQCERCEAWREEIREEARRNTFGGITVTFARYVTEAQKQRWREAFRESYREGGEG